mgnify:FL=1
MGWTISNIVADTRAKAVKADILFQMSRNKVLYVSNCALSTIFVAYCEKGEVRGIVVKATAKKIFYSSLREVATKFVPLDMGPFDYACPKKFLDMITPPTVQEKYFLNWYLNACEYHGI